MRRLSVNIQINWDEVDYLEKTLLVPNKILFVAGSKEGMYAGFARNVSQRYGCNHKIIEGASHNINSPEYVEGLRQLI